MQTPVWLVPLGLLMLYDRVWLVAELAAHLGIAVRSKCWEVLLSQRSAKNRQTDCPKRGKGAAHASIMADAHRILLPSGKDFVASGYYRDFSRKPFDYEREQARAAEGESAAKCCLGGGTSFLLKRGKFLL